MQIAEEFRRGGLGISTRKLINAMTRDFDIRCFAVKATIGGKGGGTPGLDGRRYKEGDIEELARRIRRFKAFRPPRLVKIESPKGMTPPKFRTLGIPNIIDRCWQALQLLAHDPI